MATETGVVAFIKNRLEEMSLSRFRICECGCGCKAKHLRGEVCVLCRDGDHWDGLDNLLAKIQARQDQQIADHVADPDQF